jgi:hypothetical protein
MLLALASVVFLGSESLGTLSNLRLPFSSPLTTRRVTVEVFEPTSARAISCSTLLCNHFALTTQKAQSILLGGVFTDPLCSSGRPIVARVCFHGNVFIERWFTEVHRALPIISDVRIASSILLFVPDSRTVDPRFNGHRF